MTTVQFAPKLTKRAPPKALLDRVYERMTELTATVVKSANDIAYVSTQGIEPKAITTFESKVGKKTAQWIIPKRTLQHRVSKKENLTADETSKLLRAAHIVALAEEIFADEQKALTWLDRPVPDFNNKTANEMIQTEFGARIVEDALYRLHEGYFT